MTDPTSAYIDGLRQGPGLLTAAEERTLGMAVRAGDQTARERMILANRRLVVSLARSYVGRGLSLDDLIGHGNVGLVIAVDRYDPGYGTRFGTYAAYWIREEMLSALRETVTTIRIPCHAIDLLNRWDRASQEIREGRKGGSPPSKAEVIAKLGLTSNQADHVRHARAVRRSREGSGRIALLGKTWIDDRDPFRGTVVADDVVKLKTCLDQLPPRERAAVSLRHGLDDGRPLTFSEIGGRFGVTGSRVRQLYAEALAKLRMGFRGEPIVCLNA